jgi:SAM-dependent methyltransferase
MSASLTLTATSKLKTASDRIRKHGAGRWLFEAWRRRIVLPARRAPHCPMRDNAAIISRIAGRSGLEVGGPSPFFSCGFQLPLYDKVAALDNCNYADATVWEGTITEGVFTAEGRPLGTQYICEAIDVGKRLEGKSYDFVISSNCLEHVANPLLATEAWLSVLRPSGTLVLVVPNQRSNFDHKRPVTAFAHILEDYTNGIGEDDTAHFDEVLRLTDLRLTSRAHLPNAEAFRKTVLQNLFNRCVHHHVFDRALLMGIAAHFGLERAQVYDVATDLVLVAQKPMAGQRNA